MPSRAKIKQAPLPLDLNARTLSPQVVIIAVFLGKGSIIDHDDDDDDDGDDDHDDYDYDEDDDDHHCEDDDHDDDDDPQGRLADHLSPLQTGSPPPDEDGCVSVYFELFLQFIVRDGRENLLTRVFPAVFSWAASTYNQPFLQMVSS